MLTVYEHREQASCMPPTTAFDELIFEYWGKADSKLPGEPKWHPLVYHSLDVAACGERLLECHPEWLGKLAALCGTEASTLKPWLVFLLALHDCGKFALGFQQLPGNPFESDTQVVYEPRHDTLGFSLLSEYLLAWLGRPTGDDWDSLAPWLAAVTGHHGRPPKDMDHRRALVQRHFPAKVLKDVQAFVDTARQLLCPEGWSLPEPDVVPPEQQQQASWLVAGLAVLADWLGSNTAWFRYREAGESVPDYWRNVAQPRARQAVLESGLAGVHPMSGLCFANLFPHLEKSPTPLQAWADNVPIASGPQLFILEELTGAGKTEAALTLAGRLMAAGQARGVYFALPSMATADAMYGRIREGGDSHPLWQRFFVEGEPSLVLAHSAAKTASKLEALRMERDGGYGGKEREASASQSGAAWLADSRKKALLADFGVGTIDQALLGVLQLKHQSLRLLGLSGKVLLVDEVHACDCYMGELLGRLLYFHAALGGSAILLSATLPQAQRSQLLRHFSNGAGWQRTKQSISNEYPLATHCHAHDMTQSHVEARPEVSRSVFVDALHDEEAVFQRLFTTTHENGCAVWVRNTIADALEACRQWQTRYPDIPVTLFHARFALIDRLNIGDTVTRQFGPNSTADTRHGRLVIATQVVEQSLDVDFDDLVTDLAPIDLILQRAGRLQRHKRDRQGNRAEREGRGGASLGVYMPAPDADAPAGWFKRFLPKAAAVYSDHGRLWLTAHWLAEHGGFSLPKNARAMIEAVYGDESYAATPDGLKKSSDKKEGACQSERNMARQNSLSFDYGYSSTGNSWPDEDSYTEIGTRLGDKTVRVRLARRDGDRLTSWATTGSNIDWPLSELTVPWRLIAGEAERDSSLLEAARKNMMDEGKYCLIVALEQGEYDWQGWATGPEGKSIRVIYSETLGLRIEQGEARDESDL